jgi:hypothetical protein
MNNTTSHKGSKLRSRTKLIEISYKQNITNTTKSSNILPNTNNDRAPEKPLPIKINKENKLFIIKQSSPLHK